MATIQSVTNGAEATAATAAGETQRSSAAARQPALPTATPVAVGSGISGLMARSRARLHRHSPQNANPMAAATESIGTRGMAMEAMLIEQMQSRLAVVEGMVTAATEFANNVGRDMANSAR